MHNSIRRTLLLSVGMGALLGAAAGVAAASESDSDSGGPTDVYVLNGVPAVPVEHPEVLQSTVLPPAYGALDSASKH